MLYVRAVPGLQVLYGPNITQGVFDVLHGRVDVAFVRSDLLLRLQNQGQLNASSFKTLSPVRAHCLNHCCMSASQAHRS